MSGIDEQEPPIACEECGNTSFYKVVFGSITDRATILEDNSVIIREGEWTGDDGEDWQCDECYQQASTKIKKLLNDLL